ncbi:alpha/beta hydrolase [Ferruginibacter sp.]|uniref:alpha/beta hydrolase n=1 Tax=Ferruginibacter sp. TaxID=1940288 RepID=UPI00265AE793|nr:alpha/beta fold hydrolase [Ferruginibacter sp.]
MNNRIKIKMRKWLKWLVIVYVCIGIALYFLQNLFLFHPVHLARNYQYHFNVPFKEYDIPFNTKDTINMVKFFPADSLRKGVVIYFHGNKGNINRYAKFAANFTKHGYEVWMEDYPGFGKSTGTRNEKVLYRQAKQIYALATAAFPANNIVVYGKSFGTGIAAYLASTQQCSQLILETPYYSIADLFGCYAPIYPVSAMTDYTIPSNEYLAKIKVPVTIFHGTSDGVIPYSCASRLKTVLKPTDQFITIQNGTHHNLNEYALFHQKLDSLLLQ